MRITKYIMLLLFSLLSISCEEEIDWKLKLGEADLIVVEAVLTNENKRQIIRLSKPYLEQNITPERISGATVIIKTSDGSFPAYENPVGTGIYFTDSLTAVLDKIYTLTIEYKGNSYFATASQPAVEELEPLSYSASTEEKFTIDFNKSGSEANYVKHLISWEESGNCSPGSSCKALQIFYDLKNVDVHEQFKPNQELVEFPEGTIIIRKKYSVSNGYREFLRGMLSETSWRGGVFDVFPANAASNLSQGAIGYFAVSTVLTDTTVVSP